MNAFLQSVWDHRAILGKIVIAVFLGGMAFQRIPSSSDLNAINDNLVKLLTEQRRTLDRHELDIAARLTRGDVRAMIEGPENPWIRQSSVVMPVIARYAEERDRVRDDISALWRAIGARRGDK